MSAFTKKLSSGIGNKAGYPKVMYIIGRHHSEELSYTK
jgi:hypothetical protein